MPKSVRSFQNRGHRANRGGRKPAVRIEAARAIRTAACIDRLEPRMFLSSAIAAFGVQQTFAAVTSPASLTSAVVADVNGDGKSDAVVAEINSSSVAVLLG